MWRRPNRDRFRSARPQEISVQADVPRCDAVRGERAPFPAGVGIREDRDPEGLVGTFWHAEDARKRILGTAQP